MPNTWKISEPTINMDYVIGCDLGSQGIKVILLTADGQLAGEASVSYGIDYPYSDLGRATGPAGGPMRCARRLESCCSTQVSRRTKFGHRPGCAGGWGGSHRYGRESHCGRPSSGWTGARWINAKQLEQVCDPKRIFQITGLNLDARMSLRRSAGWRIMNPKYIERLRISCCPAVTQPSSLPEKWRSITRTPLRPC